MAGTPLAHLLRNVPALIILAVGAAMQLAGSAVPDVSWYLVLGGEVLSGKTLYLDMLETNPPMSVLLYLPAMWVERHLGLPAEPVVVVQVMAAILGSLLVTMGLLVRGGLAPDRRVTEIVLAFALTMLPIAAFAQREHIALVVVLPLFALAALRSAGDRAPLWLTLLAGAGGGLAVAIKPHFALALALPYIFAAIRSNSFRTVFGHETLAALAIGAGYASVVVFLFPAYLRDIVPMLLDTYRASHYELPAALLSPLSGVYWILVLVGIMTTVERPTAAWPRQTVFLVASFGFYVAYIEQAKLFAYQAYPAVALAAFVALTALVGASFAARAVVLVRAAAMAFSLLVAATWFGTRASMPELVDAVRSVAPANPRILIVGHDFALAHPLTRELDGRWVSSVSAQWITDSARMQMIEDPDNAALADRMEDWIAKDRARLAEDILAGRPDVLLFDRRWMDWLAWAREDAAFAAELARFEPAMDVRGIAIWRRAGAGPAIAP